MTVTLFPTQRLTVSYFRIAVYSSKKPMDIVLPPSDSKRHSVAGNGADNPAYHMETDETASYEHLSPKPEDYGENSTVERFTTEPVATATDEGPVPLAQLHVCVLNNELSSDTWSDTSSTVDDGHDVGQGTGDSNTSSADDYIPGPKSAVETRFDVVPSTNFNLSRSGIYLPDRTCTCDPFVTTDGEEAQYSDSESTHRDPFSNSYQRVGMYDIRPGTITPW